MIRGPRAPWNDNFTASKQASIKRKCAWTKQSDCYAYHDQIGSDDGIRVPTGCKGPETLFARLPSEAQAPAIGVRKPIISAVPMRISSDPIAQPDMCARDPMRVLAPLSIALTATVRRIRTRPTPGHPSGKVEKSFCSRSLLGREQRTGNENSFCGSGTDP